VLYAERREMDLPLKTETKGGGGHFQVIHHSELVNGSGGRAIIEKPHSQRKTLAGSKGKLRKGAPRAKGREVDASYRKKVGAI